LALYAFSPTILANARLVTTDLPAALCLTASAGAIWRLMGRVTLPRALVAALALAALCLSKMSWVVILPIAGALLVVRLIDPAPLTVAAFRRVQCVSRLSKAGALASSGLFTLILVGGLLWAGFGFRYSAYADAVPGRDTMDAYKDRPAGTDSWEFVLEDNRFPQRFIRLLRDHKILPEAYLFGMAYTLSAMTGVDAFLLGEIRHGGWWYFYPYCLLVKTPIPILLLLTAGLVVWLVRIRRDPRSAGRSLTVCAPLWILLVAYWCFALTSRFNLGHRLILPTYPAMFILAGALGAWFARRKLALKVAGGGLVLWVAVEAMAGWPHYLAYFNPIHGGPAEAYRHLVDSSLDWGQDLPGLKKWLADSGAESSTSPVYLSYFGTADPAYYGIRARALPSFDQTAPMDSTPLRGGIYCISATTLQQILLLPTCRWTVALENAYQKLRKSPLYGGRLNMFLHLRFARLCAFLRRAEPDHQIGHSILIYRLTDEQVRTFMAGDPPELVADDAQTLKALRERAAQWGVTAPDIFEP
jgi:hypothetical protein